MYRGVHPDAKFTCTHFSDQNLQEWSARFSGNQAPISKNRTNFPKTGEDFTVVEEDQVSKDGLLLLHLKNKNRSKLQTTFIVPYQRQVVNQGECSSCWAQASKYLMEDILKGAVSVSAQQILDCSGGGDCSGGTHVQGLHYILDHGYVLESVYPYQESKGNSCRRAKGKKVDYHYSHKISSQDPKTYKRILQDNLVSLDINIKAMPYLITFSGGILDPNQKFCQEKVDHTVTVIGFDDEDIKKGIWVIKNSWGPAWGDNGYMRLYQHKEMDGRHCFCGKSQFGCYAITALKNK